MVFIREKDFLELYSQGKTDRQISNILGCHEKSVGRFRRERNLPLNNGRVIKEKPKEINKVKFVPYKEALPPHQWEYMDTFLKTCVMAKREGGKKFDLSFLIKQIHSGKIQLEEYVG